MSQLPANTPRWRIWILNLLAFVIMGGVVAVTSWAGWQACLWFMAGYLTMYFAVRLKYGFWPFNGDQPVSCD